MLAVFFTTGSCDIDSPIFYIISIEVKPVDPKIEGAPTNFAVFDKTLYTASGTKLWHYKEFPEKENEKDYRWEEHPVTPSDGTEKIMQIASTSKYLYALCYDDENSRIKITLKKLVGSNWEPIEFDVNDSSIQRIFTVYDTLFAGVRIENSTLYHIYYINENENTLSKKLTYIDDEGETADVSGELSGAVFDGNGTYYICTRRGGIYKTSSLSDENTAILVSGSDNVDFTGIIGLQDKSNTIIAITRQGGVLYTVNDSVTRTGISMESRFSSTGALALWIDKDDASRRLLLAGRQDSLEYTTNSGYTYGYLELELDEYGIKSGKSFKEPGANPARDNPPPPSTVDDNELFITTIGKYPVNYIVQTPDSIDREKVLFASTQQNGVWSYRVRKGTPQWNAEDGQHDDQ